VLYRLPSVLAASPNVVIYAVEGEKDADRLRSYGFVATTSPGGAGKWRDEYSQSLAGRPVVILPDNDEPGRRHAEQVQQSLRGVGARVEILTLQGLPDKGDVSDWLDMGHTDDELDALTAQLWHREQTAEDQPGRATEPQPANEVNRWTPKPLSELVASEVEIPWLWEGYLASGMVTLLTGLWKSGKSTLLSHLLKDLSGAADDFGGQYVREARALVVSEEAERHWITRRDSLLIGDHVSIISRPFLKNPTPAAWEAFLTELQGHVVSGGFNLLVFDSLPNLWAVRNENDNADVKAAILPMNMLTEAGASVLLIAHPAKGDTGEGKATRGAGALPGFVDVIVEMRRYDAENRTDTRRVLTSYSRFDETPVEACLEYIGTAGYRSVGTRSEVTTRSRKETLNTILPTSGDGDTVEDILSNWPGDDHNKPTRGAVAALLNYMASLGEINRSGKGRRGNPYRYRLSLTNPDYLVSNRPISA
nr:AAA family ATPase [Chloroflexota bacterium]